MSNESLKKAKAIEVMSTGGLAFTTFNDYLQATVADINISLANSSAQWGTALAARKYRAYHWGLQHLNGVPTLTDDVVAMYHESAVEYLNSQQVPPPTADNSCPWHKHCTQLAVTLIADCDFLDVNWADFGEY